MPLTAAEPDTAGAEIPPETDAIGATSAKPAPQGAGSSTTASCPASVATRRATAAPEVPGGMYLLTRKNFSNIVVKAEWADKQVNNLLSEIPVFVNRAIEKALKP